MKKYDHQKVEGKWQKFWRLKEAHEPNFSRNKPRKNPRKKFFNLMMFPYPSAEGLHVGNMYAFTGADIYGRFMRMRGFDVFEPIGLDGFGIHSENYALKTNTHPVTLAKKSEKNFYRQLGLLGNSFAWNEKLETYDPDYYRITQWLIREMFERGLAYRKTSPVNWCPSCKTVLADEQVISGKCERCDSVVEKKELAQWFLRITRYAEELLSDLGTIDWSEKVLTAQRNWIGKSEGAEINFELVTDQKPNFVLIHGYNGSPEKNFHPWLKKELERRGYSVQVPSLPNPAEPNIEEQIEYVLKNTRFDENTVLLGHSLGTVVAMKVAERLPHPIRKLILVAGFIKPDLTKNRPYVPTFTWTYDFKKIKNNAQNIILLRDPNDSLVSQDRTEKLHGAIGGTLTDVTPNMDHIRGEREPSTLTACLDSVRVFTTRPDTIFGATYLVLGPEHPTIEGLRNKIQNLGEVQKYVQAAKEKTADERIKSREKTGVALQGVSAINPATKEPIPVWISDYVIGDVGTGAIMAVPAHDDRDLEFAKKFHLPIRQVIAPHLTVTEGPDAPRKDKPTIKRKTVYVLVRHHTENKYLCLNWDKFGWHSGIIGGVEDNEDPVKAAHREIQEETGYQNLKFIKTVGEETHNEYYAAHKAVNRYAMATGMLFQLIDDSKKEIEPEHGKNHTPVWIEEKMMRQWLNLKGFQYMWEVLQSGRECFTGDGILINSDSFNGKKSEEVKKEIAEFVGGKLVTKYRLRDWLISRQRYWGPPMPFIFCEACAQRIKDRELAIKGKKYSKGELENPGWIAAPEKDLPIQLPFVKDFRPTGTGVSPLASAKAFVNVKCPKCGGKARRETDVSDTFVDSAWYYIGYLLKSNSKRWTGKKMDVKKSFAELEKKNWLPVNMYTGGAEHSVLHLLYSRFMAKALNDWGLVGFREPFTKFRAHGLIIKDGAKMSKSKGNVINPDHYIKEFGADALRMYLMFLGPFEHGGDFRDEGILGIERFLKRVWNLAQKQAGAPRSKNASSERLLHRSIKKIGEDIENLKYNTAVSQLMVLLNTLEENPQMISKDECEIFLKLLNPFAPHIAHELWQLLGNKTALDLEPWPEYDPKLIEESTFQLIIQVNGKMRDTIEAPKGISQAAALALAQKAPNAARHITGEPKKVVFVPDRLINLIV